MGSRFKSFGVQHVFAVSVYAPLHSSSSSSPGAGLRFVKTYNSPSFKIASLRRNKPLFALQDNGPKTISDLYAPVREVVTIRKNSSSRSKSTKKNSRVNEIELQDGTANYAVNVEEDSLEDAAEEEEERERVLMEGSSILGNLGTSWSSKTSASFLATTPQDWLPPMSGDVNGEDLRSESSEDAAFEARTEGPMKKRIKKTS